MKRRWPSALLLCAAVWMSPACGPSSLQPRVYDAYSDEELTLHYEKLQVELASQQQDARRQSEAVQPVRASLSERAVSDYKRRMSEVWLELRKRGITAPEPPQ